MREMREIREMTCKKSEKKPKEREKQTKESEKKERKKLAKDFCLFSLLLSQVPTLCRNKPSARGKGLSCKRGKSSPPYHYR